MTLILARALFTLEKILFSHCVLVLESEGLYHPPLMLEATKSLPWARRRFYSWFEIDKKSEHILVSCRARSGFSGRFPVERVGSTQR